MTLSPAEWEAIRLSLLIGLAAVAWILPPGIAVAWWLARHHFRGKALVNGLIHLPLVLPPVVVGYLLLISLGRQGVGEAWVEGWKGDERRLRQLRVPDILLLVQIRQHVCVSELNDLVRYQ